MAKYLTKEQVVAYYKVNILPNMVDVSPENQERAWGMLLEAFVEVKKISKKQGNIWKFPKELLD